MTFMQKFSVFCFVASAVIVVFVLIIILFTPRAQDVIAHIVWIGRIVAVLILIGAVAGGQFYDLLRWIGGILGIDWT